MNAKEKIKYVKDAIDERVAISPTGPMHLRLYELTEYEEGPTLIHRSEQRSILLKFEEEGYIKNLTLDQDGCGAWFEMGDQKNEPQKIRRSNLLSHIKTIDDFLRNRELYEKFVQMVGDTRIIKAGHKYKLPTEEQNDDLIQLLIDLGVVEYDWGEIQKQTHREVGNRIIEYTLSGDKFLEIVGRVTGKDGHVRREVLELISKEIGNRLTFQKIAQFFRDQGVPESMFVQDTKWSAVFYVLSYYATAEYGGDFHIFLKLIQEVLHPLAFEGDTAKTSEAREKYRNWLKYDRIHIEENGKVYLLPSAEERDLAILEWMDADGKTVDPIEDLLNPSDLAKLWVLWNQIILLESSYRTNGNLDKKDLEKLYFEVIGQTEEIIKYGELFSLKHEYKRPFTSLATAEMEARAKGIGSPLELLGEFLLKIIALNPDPAEVMKETEQYAEMIARIAVATQAIGGETIEADKISYEQAIFLLKLFMPRIVHILEAVATGEVFMADENLNAQYIFLYDNIFSLLEREDCKALHDDLPPDLLRKHLFDAMDELDVWWEFAQSQLMSFVGDIESAWVRAGKRVFPIPGWLAKQFGEIDEAIKQHRKDKTARWDRIIKNIDANRAREDTPLVPSSKAIAEERILKVQLVPSSEVMVRNPEDAVVVKKKKRISLPKFSRAEWADVSIRFIDERNVLLTGGAKQVSVDYEGLGFSNDKKNTPNRAWGFLFEMAENGGETKVLPTPIPDKIKQLKLQVADRLRTIFKNDTDPFYDANETKTYKAKFKLISPEIEVQAQKDDLGIKDFLDEMTDAG
jgi:hypothetical protein